MLTAATCLLVDASLADRRRTTVGALRRRSGIGPTLERHPFSGLVDSAGELLHTP